MAETSRTRAGPGSEQIFMILISYPAVHMALESSLSCETPLAHCPTLSVCFLILRLHHSETAELPTWLSKGEFVLWGQGQCGVPLGENLSRTRLVVAITQGSSQLVGPGRELLFIHVERIAGQLFLVIYTECPPFPTRSCPIAPWHMYLWWLALLRIPSSQPNPRPVPLECSGPCWNVTLSPPTQGRIRYLVFQHVAYSSPADSSPKYPPMVPSSPPAPSWPQFRPSHSDLREAEIASRPPSLLWPHTSPILP